MAQPSTSVTSAIPAVRLFPITIPAGQPTIQILEIPENGSYLIAYDKHIWAPEQIDGYARMYVGDYELIEAPAEGGAQ